MAKKKANGTTNNPTTATTSPNEESSSGATSKREDISLDLAGALSKIPARDKMKIFLKIQGIRKKMAGRGTQTFKSFDELKEAIMGLDPMFSFLRDVDESQVLGLLSLMG